MDSDSKSKLRRGSWNACGFATNKLEGVRIAEQESKRNEDVVGNQESWAKGEAEIGCKVGGVHIVEKGEEQKRENWRAGRVGVYS